MSQTVGQTNDGPNSTHLRCARQQQKRENSLPVFFSPLRGPLLVEEAMEHQGADFVQAFGGAVATAIGRH